MPIFIKIKFIYTDTMNKTLRKQMKQEGSSYIMKLWSESMPYQNNAIDFTPYLTPYIVEGSKIGVVVCPGGAYFCRAEHEGISYAKWLNSIGVSAIVLDYRVTPYQSPAPCCDVQRAIRVAKKELSQHGAHKIGVMGSSAGGHLAASASVHYDKVFYEPQDEIDEICARPDFTILCYPVIDMYEFRHDGSRINLMGNTPKKSEKDFYSLHLQVTDNTPPAFLWHTSNDQAVPAENSILYAMALSEHNIPYELHIYPDGSHGLGLAMDFPHVNQWLDALKHWLNRYI